MENSTSPIKGNTPIPSQSTHVPAAKQQTSVLVGEAKTTFLETYVPPATFATTVYVAGRSEQFHHEEAARLRAEASHQLTLDMAKNKLEHSAYIQRGVSLKLKDHEIVEKFHQAKVIDDHRVYIIKDGELVRNVETPLTVPLSTESTGELKENSGSSSGFASISSGFQQSIAVPTKPAQDPSTQEKGIPLYTGAMIILSSVLAASISYMFVNLFKSNRIKDNISTELFENTKVRQMIIENKSPFQLTILKENFTALRLGVLTPDGFRTNLKELLQFSDEEINSFFLNSK